VTHATKFENPGDYRTFEVAGFPFIVILGKDRQIRAFHNVCRHRAYAVTNKECGSSTVLRCRYHGWSYDSRGKLIKAPEFEGVKGFEKDLNGLWEVKTEIRESMIFVNLDVGNEVTSQVLSDGEGNLRRWKTNDMSWIEEWKLEGRFNWKLAGKYLYTRELRKWSMLTYKAGFLLPSNSGREGLSSFLSFGSSDEYLNMFHTTVFRRLRSGQLLTLRLLPLSRNTTRIECNLYGTGSRTNRNRVDNLKMEIQFAIEQLEFRQHTLMHNGSDYSDCK
jgi:nitrite reductase/ring-hydroxylating ferredoxin subunit